MWLRGCSTALDKEGEGDHRSRLGDRERLGDLAVAPGESHDLAERGEVARVGELAESCDLADSGDLAKSGDLTDLGDLVESVDRGGVKFRMPASFLLVTVLQGVGNGDCAIRSELLVSGMMVEGAGLSRAMLSLVQPRRFLIMYPSSSIDQPTYVSMHGLSA